MRNREAARIAEIEANLMADSPLALEPPRIRRFDEPELLPERNAFTMSSGIARTPGGRLWISWFGGEDGPNAYLMMASSEDDGKSWTDPRFIIREPLTPHGFPRSILGGNLWSDPQGRLWCFFTYQLSACDGRGGVWASVCKNPDDAEPAWSVPVRLWHGFALNKPVVLSNGNWLLPTSLWDRHQILEEHRLAACSLFTELDPWRMANFLVSSDRGATWKRRGGVYAHDRLFDEPSFIEKKNGALFCLLRTHYGLAETVSSDFGCNWSRPKPSLLRNTSSARIFMQRLASGRILLVKNDPLYEAGKLYRADLTAYLSEDDGATWIGGLVLDARNPVSYPDGFQAPDGTLYIAYDRKRVKGEIMLAVFTEEDIMQGAPVSRQARLKVPVKRCAGVREEIA